MYLFIFSHLDQPTLWATATAVQLVIDFYLFSFISTTIPQMKMCVLNYELFATTQI